jgi:hypothetical protein
MYLLDTPASIIGKAGDAKAKYVEDIKQYQVRFEHFVLMHSKISSCVCERETNVSPTLGRLDYSNW